MRGECRHGISGKKDGTCPHSHPKRCPTYMKWGSKDERGCTMVLETCKKVHPTLCPKSLDLRCYDKQCPYKLHATECQRSRPPPYPPVQGVRRRNSADRGNQQGGTYAARVKDGGNRGNSYPGQVQQDRGHPVGGQHPHPSVIHPLPSAPTLPGAVFPPVHDPQPIPGADRQPGAHAWSVPQPIPGANGQPGAHAWSVPPPGYGHHQQGAGIQHHQPVGFPHMTAQQQLGALYQQLMNIAMAMNQNPSRVGGLGQVNPYPSSYSTPTV